MNDIVGWFEWFNLKNDPFSTSPITSANQEKLFYKTLDIQNTIDPIIKRLDISDVFIKLLIGERGLGKTTALNYIEKEVQNFDFIIPIPIEISFRNPNDVHPEIFIGEDILFQFIHKVLSYIYLNKNGVWVHHNEFFNKALNNSGLEIYFDEIFPDPTKFPDFPTLRVTADNILRLCEKEKFRIILLIDQIDKDPIEYALKFLKSSHSQTILEMFTSSDSMIFITCKTDLYKKMFTGDRIDEDFSYLSDIIMLEPLKQTEVIELLNCRFYSEANESFQNPLDIEVIHSITVSEKGITRYIITRIKEKLQKAYKLKEKKITIDLYKSKRFNIRDFSEIYYRLVDEDGTSKVASERLTKLYFLLGKNKESYKNAFNLIRKIHTPKGLFKKEEYFIHELEDQKLLLRNEKRELIVAPEISIFFNKLKEKGITIEDFIRWFTESEVEEISLVKTKIEPDRVINIFDDLLEEIKIAEINTIIKTDRYGTKEEVTGDLLRQMILKRIQTSRLNYIELRNIDWEETAKPEIFRRINETWFRFLEAFSFFSSSYFKDYLSFKDNRRMWDNIYYFLIIKSQAHFDIYLDNWNNLRQLRKAGKEILVDKIIEPGSQELVEDYNQMEDIIIEVFDKIWSEMLNISKDSPQKSDALQMNNIIETNRKIIHEESINVGQRIKAERIIEEWLKKIEGDVYGWLNYVDQTTIGYLNNLPRTCKIQIITSEIQNKNKFQTEASKLGKVIPKLEIKVIRVNPEISSDKSQDFSEKERAIIHKRKLITNETIIDFGTDLKSSALGNTKHSMLLMAADLSNLEEFAEEWNRDGDEWKRIEGIPIKVTYYKWPNE